MSQRSPRLLDSFNYAFEGIIHVLRTQRNMRIHVTVAVAVLVVAITADVSKLELCALLVSIAFVSPEEIRALKRDHLGVDAVTDVLSFPIDGAEPLAEGMPRLLGDVVICPQVTGEAWRAPLTHGLLHLLGYDHGERMELREQELAR